MLLFILMGICAEFLLSFICMYCRWRISYQKRRVGIPLTGLTLPHLCACPNPGTGFPSSYVVVFWCSVSLFQIIVIVCFVGIVYHKCLEVVVCFVDIGGIDDHHCLEVVVCFVDMGEIIDHHY